MKRIILVAGLLLYGATSAWAQSRPLNAGTVNSSATIATGNTFQTVLAANSKRQSVTIQNNNTNNDNCWLFIGSAAAAKGTSILLAPGGSYQRYSPYVPTDAIQATCATTNDTMYIDTN